MATTAVVEHGADLDVATARFFRVLGHPTRLAILELLLERPRTVSELVDVLAQSQSSMSNHLACLRWCRVAVSERHGREVTYRIDEPAVRDVVAAARILAAQHCDHLTSCTRIGPDWI
jgi:DNA-binding transcriptional ArsR family regulator